MAFPSGWPPRPASGLRSIRFYQPSTAATADFSDNAFLFADGVGANPIKALSQLDAGDETNPTPVGENDPVFDAGGSPVGGGRSPKDAHPYDPNLFLRGTGGGTSSFTQAGSTTTFVDPSPSKPFTRDLVGKEFRVAGATTAGNDGDFRIASVPSATSLTYENATGVTEAFPVLGTYRLRTINDAPPKGMIWAQTIRITATTAAVEFSFDGVNVHGIVPSGATHVYRARYEAGIAVRGVGATFVIEAW